jgi:hypothetical protein
MMKIKENCFQANVSLGKTSGPLWTRRREKKDLSLLRIELGYSIG